MHWPRRPRKPQCGDYNEKPNESITHQLYFQNTLLTQVFNDFNHLSDEYGGYISLMGCLFFPRKNRLRIRKPNRLISSSLRASSPIWASEASLARTCERVACVSERRSREGRGKALGASLARSREAHFASPNWRACSQATYPPGSS